MSETSHLVMTNILWPRLVCKKECLTRKLTYLTPCSQNLHGKILQLVQVSNAFSCKGPENWIVNPSSFSYFEKLDSSIFYVFSIPLTRISGF